MTVAPPRIFFFILKVKSDVYFISLSGKKREILIIYESKMQKLLSATGNLGVHLERISFKCPTVQITAVKDEGLKNMFVLILKWTLFSNLQL